MTNAQYARLSLWLIAIWFASSLIVSALHLFRNNPSQPPLGIGLAVALPIVAFLVWMASSPGFRHFVFSLDPRALTIVHTWRLVGFAFLVLYAYGILPGLFALPAGWGDIAIGATAPFVALRLADGRHRTSFLLWQALGILDFVIAVSAGTLTPVLQPYGVGTAALSALPLSLFPTFFVPLLAILHIVCIAQALSWNQSTYSHVRSSLFPAA
jgi:hypothetical protein